MIKVGILGAAGYTGGELIRLLLNHPQAEIVFANSESNAGNLVSDVHEGLYGDTDLRFTADMPFDDVDVVFFCFGHGKSKEFLQKHAIPSSVKIIDLAQDFRIKDEVHDFVYGLPEIHKDEIAKAQHVANPGCYATCIQLGLLPAAKMGILQDDVMVNGITGSTGAGQKPTFSSHFSWRDNNVSTYKILTHQHLHEICQSLNEVRPATSPYITSPIDSSHITPLQGGDGGGRPVSIDFIPYRGPFPRGIFVTSVVQTDASLEEITEGYKSFYKYAAFTHVMTDHDLDLKQVVNTNKCLIHLDKVGNKLIVISCIDNLLKGAVGQAVQNMNIMFHLDETAGLRLKPSAF